MTTEVGIIKYLNNEGRQKCHFIVDPRLRRTEISLWRRLASTFIISELSSEKLLYA